MPWYQAAIPARHQPIHRKPPPLPQPAAPPGCGCSSGSASARSWTPSQIRTVAHIADANPQSARDNLHQTVPAGRPPRPPNRCQTPAAKTQDYDERSARRDGERCSWRADPELTMVPCAYPQGEARARLARTRHRSSAVSPDYFTAGPPPRGPAPAARPRWTASQDRPGQDEPGRDHRQRHR
jgi:hypothetical protein